MKRFGLDRNNWRKIGKGRVDSPGGTWQSSVAGVNGTGFGFARPSASAPPLTEAAPNAAVEARPDETTVPTGAPGPEMVKVAEENRTDYEVKKMETSAVSKMQMTGRGRYSNVPAAANRQNEEPRPKEAKPAAGRRGNRDLQSGMEILDLDFLLGVIENTEAEADQDITMRRLSFSEIIRTQRVHEVDSQVLKEYAMDSDGHWGKDIQVESFKELASRTASHAKG